MGSGLGQAAVRSPRGPKLQEGLLHRLLHGTPYPPPELLSGGLRGNGEMPLVVDGRLRGGMLLQVPPLPIALLPARRSAAAAAHPSLAALPFGRLRSRLGGDDEGLIGAPPQVGPLGQGQPEAIFLPKGFSALCLYRRLAQPSLVQRTFSGQLRLPMGFGLPIIGRDRMGDPHRLSIVERRWDGTGVLGGAGRSHVPVLTGLARRGW